MIFNPSFWGIVNAAMALVVYYDQRLNSRSGIGWVFLVAVTGPIGLLIYFLYSRDTLELAAKRHRKDRLKEVLESNTPPRPEEDDRSYLSALPASLTGETGFCDPELDALMEQGKMDEAREYLERMIKTAEDMGDKKVAHKYRGYLTPLEMRRYGR